MRESVQKQFWTSSQFYGVWSQSSHTTVLGNYCSYNSAGKLWCGWCKKREISPSYLTLCNASVACDSIYKVHLKVGAKNYCWKSCLVSLRESWNPNGKCICHIYIQTSIINGCHSIREIEQTLTTMDVANTTLSVSFKGPHITKSL